MKFTLAELDDLDVALCEAREFLGWSDQRYLDLSIRLGEALKEARGRTTPVRLNRISVKPHWGWMVASLVVSGAAGVVGVGMGMMLAALIYGG